MFRYLDTHGLLFLIDSHPCLLLKDDGSEILKVNFVCDTPWPVHTNVLHQCYLFLTVKSGIVFYLVYHRVTSTLVPTDGKDKMCAALRTAVFKRKLVFPWAAEHCSLMTSHQATDKEAPPFRSKPELSIGKQRFSSRLVKGKTFCL